MNDEGVEMVADRIQSEFQRLDGETKQWHNNKTKSTLVVHPYPCLDSRNYYRNSDNSLYLCSKFCLGPRQKRKQLQ